MASFASEHLVADPVERFRALKLYKTYQEWCRDHGCRPTKSLNFWKRMVKAGFEKGKDRDGKYYRVKLVNDWRVEGCDNRIDLLDDEDAGLSLILGGGAGS